MATQFYTLGGKWAILGGKVATESPLAAAPLVMVGGKSSTLHPQGVIVAAFTNLDGTHPVTLNVTSLSDGASNTKYTIDQFNNVLTGTATPTVGTDSITITGTLNGAPFVNVPFAISVIDGATATVSGPKVLFTPASGAGAVTYITPGPANATWNVIDETVPPPAGSILGQLSIIDDPGGLFSSPTYFQQAINGGSTAYVKVSSGGLVTTTSSFVNQIYSAATTWLATDGSNACFGHTSFFMTTLPRIETSTVSGTTFSNTTTPTISAALTTPIAYLAQYLNFSTSGFTPAFFNGNMATSVGTAPSAVTFLLPGSSAQVTIAGTVMTVHGTLSGKVVVGLELYSSSVPSGLTIISPGTGLGGAGTYNLSASTTLATVTTIPLLPPGSGVFNATIVSGNITVDASPLGQPTVGQTIYGPSIPASTTLLTYDGVSSGTVSNSGLSVSDEAMTSFSLPTVNGSVSVNFTPSYALFESMTWSAGIVTARLPGSGDRFFLPGCVFSISGTSPSAYNGIVTAAAGTNATTITWALASDPGPVTVLGQLDTQFVLAQQQHALPSLYVTSTAAPTDGSCVVATVNATLYDQCTTWLQDDAGGLFRMSGTEETPHNYVVCGQLSPGTYSLLVRCLGKQVVFSMTTAVEVQVLDATPTSGCSISVTPPVGLLNNANIGTVIATPSVSGITGGTWCLHQNARMGFYIDPSTGQVTNILPLQWGNYQLTFVCSDGAGHNAQETINFTIAKKIGPTVTVGVGLPNSTPYTGPNDSGGSATYPDLISFFTDQLAQSTTQIACALSGFQLTLLHHPSGSWVDQTIRDNSIGTPGDFFGDPTSPTRVSISASPSVGIGQAYIPVSDVDFSISNIQGSGSHDFTAGSPNGRFLQLVGVNQAGGTSRIRVTNCDFQDNDHGIQGGSPGAILEIHGSVLRQNSVGGQTHNSYFLNGAYIEFVDSVSVSCLAGGHDFKSRGLYGKVVNSLIGDLNNGSSSSPVDICNGGYYLFATSTFQLGPNNQNWNCIQFHAENQVQNSLIDVIQSYNNVFICDDVDSGQHRAGLGIDSRYCVTPAVVIDTGSVFYGPFTNNYDTISGPYNAPVGSAVTASQVSTRPALVYVDPATGTAPPPPFAPPYVGSQGPHGGYSKNPVGVLVPDNMQSIIGSNAVQGDTITVSSSVAFGTVIETFQIVTGLVKWETATNIGYHMSAPVWAIATNPGAIDPTVSPNYTAGGNITGLAINSSTGALTTSVGPGGLALGLRKVVVGATQTGRTSKMTNVMILVTP